MKGETSGHTQKIKRVVADCDYDTLLYVVEQKGTVCHTGAATCFHHEFEC
jgi:phosphoribosyl-ATP pyrophosphohydrolase/phosphoribosyl-AMP cyclohydrolase